MTPTYNERDNIDEFLRQVQSVDPEIDIFVVDDNSPDGTGLRALELARMNPKIHVISRSGDRGYAAASREGLMSIAADGYDVIVTLDCDLSHNPQAIPTMIARINSGADVVIGSRYVQGGGVRNWTLFRRLLSRWGNLYTALMLGVGIRDCTSGFRAYRGEVVRAGIISSTTSSGYAFLTEVLFRLRQSKVFAIVEVPIVYVDRTAGESKMSKTIISESMRLVTKWGLRRFTIR
jgi:dolichol-phosphate mannosyltransferase